MRKLMLIVSCMMLAAAARTRALEWNAFSINQNPVPATAVVSFSIGYPNGWQAMQNSSWRRDVYSGLVTPLPGEVVCIFEPPSTVDSTNFPLFTIFYDHGRPAKDAAESFAREMDLRKTEPSPSLPNLLPVKPKPLAGITIMGPYVEKSLRPIQTTVGDSGWLLESEANSTAGKVISQEYFFCSGKKGSIRIEIVTPGCDQGLRSDLDKLVLQTLQF